MKRSTHVKIIQKNLKQRKKNKHTPSVYSLFTNCSFDSTKSKLDCFKGKDCTEMFCKDLREHAMRIISYEQKEMIHLIDEENGLYEV